MSFVIRSFPPLARLILRNAAPYPAGGHTPAVSAGSPRTDAPMLPDRALVVSPNSPPIAGGLQASSLAIGGLLGR